MNMHLIDQLKKRLGTDSNSNQDLMFGGPIVSLPSNIHNDDLNGAFVVKTSRESDNQNDIMENS